MINTPEAKAFLRQKLTGMIRDRINREVVPQFTGTRGARLEINVVSFFIPSPLQRVALGGSPTMAAARTLKDARTGAELAKLDQMSAGMAGNGILGVAIDQGFSDLEDRVLDNFTAQTKKWLLKQ